MSAAIELPERRYGSYLGLLRQERDIGPLFRRRSIPADVIMCNNPRT
jgi:hypothetical protein